MVLQVSEGFLVCSGPLYLLWCTQYQSVLNFHELYWGICLTEVVHRLKKNILSTKQCVRIRFKKYKSRNFILHRKVKEHNHNNQTL